MSSGIYIYISSIIPLHQLSRYGPGYGYIWERCGEPTELEGREFSINTPPHLSRHPKRIHKKERFLLEERWERVRGCDMLPGREEPHKLRGSMKKCAKPPSTVISAISKVHLYQPPHRRLLFCPNSQSPPTAIWRKPDINDKEQQTMEPVEMDFSMTAQIREMDCSISAQITEINFSEYMTKKRVEMDYSMATQEPVERVMATDTVLMAVLMMMLQMATILCPMLTSRRGLPARTGVRLHPSDKEVAPPVSRETVVYTRDLQRINDTACQAAAMTKKSILLLNTDNAYYHYMPQLVPLQASEEAMIWWLLASNLIKAGKLQAHKLQYDLYCYWQANYIDTASPNHEVDDKLYMTLLEGTDASAIFARLNKAINGHNQTSYEDLQWRQLNGCHMSSMWLYAGYVDTYHFPISL